MPRKDHIDAFGFVCLTASSTLLGINQVVIKLVNDGLQPVFFAGLRSAGAIFCIWVWMRLNGRPLRIEPGTVGAGILIGLVFSAEFLFLFLALDLTTVVRSAVIFYSMPVWLAIAAHFFLPGERITPQKALGLAVAFAGVVVALGDRGGPPGQATLAGDLCALAAAFGWAGTAFFARASAMARVRPEMQLFWMVLVSAPVLLVASLFFGPLVRALTVLHLWMLAFQIVVVVSAGFIFWLWLLSVYPASGVASFGFLTPILGVALGWRGLGGHVGPLIFVSAALVALGIVLINRPARAAVP